MRRSNCAGRFNDVPELTWILFLRILDEREARERMEAEAVGAPFAPSLALPLAGLGRAQRTEAPGTSERRARH